MRGARFIQPPFKTNIHIPYRLRAVTDLKSYSSASVSRQKRLFQTTSINSTRQESSQKKDDLSPRSKEYSQSAGDDNAAALEKTAFNPSDNSPEKEMRMAEEESEQVTTPKQNIAIVTPV
jgi:hypothetical protein